MFISRKRFNKIEDHILGDQRYTYGGMGKVKCGRYSNGLSDRVNKLEYDNARLTDLLREVIDYVYSEKE